MNLKIHFYLEEKIKFLEQKGFEVKKTLVEMGYPCYHNDMDVENKEVWAVFKNSQEYLKPGGYNFEESEWLDRVFEDEISRKLSKLILNE